MSVPDWRLSIDHCRVFVAICDTRSFSLAAHELCRTQSAVTHQIKVLEEILGDSLFHRGRGSFKGLTDAGREFEPFARRILASVSELSNLRAERGCGGHVRLGVMDDFGIEGLAMAIARFGDTHARATITTICDLSARLERRFTDGELDLVLTKTVLARTETPGPDMFDLERLHWVCGQGFSWPRNQAAVPLVVFHEGCAYRSRLLEGFRFCSARWAITYAGYSYANIRSAIAANLGVSLLPSSQIGAGQRICDDEAERLGLPVPGFSALQLKGGGAGAPEIVQIFKKALLKAILPAPSPVPPASSQRLQAGNP